MNIETLKIIYESVKEQLNLQIQLIDSLDTKAGVLIGFNGIILSIMLTLYNKVFIPLFIVGVIFFLVSMLIAYMGYKTEKFRRDPDPKKLRIKYSSKTVREITEVLIDNMIASFEENSNKIKQKAGFINKGFIASEMGILLLFLSIIIGG